MLSKVNENQKNCIAMPANVIPFDTTTMYSVWKNARADRQNYHFESEVTVKQEENENRDVFHGIDFPRNLNPGIFSNGKTQCRDLPSRLQQKFSTLDEVEVITETDSRTDSSDESDELVLANAFGRNKVSTKFKTNLESDTVTVILLGRSEELVSSNRSTSSRCSPEQAALENKDIVVQRSSGENEVKPYVVERKHEPNTPVSTRHCDNRERRASVQHICSFLTHQIQHEERDKIRKSSLSSHSGSVLMDQAQVEKRSLKEPRDISYVQDVTLDNHTELQWERLVARARNLQTLSSPIPERAHSKIERKGNRASKVDNGISSLVRMPLVEDTESEEEDSSSDVCSEASHDSSSGSSHTSCLGEAFVVIAKPNRKDLDTELQNEKKDTENSVTQNEDTFKEKADEAVCDLKDDKSVNTGIVMDKSVSQRRFSLATLRPPTEVRERISGYSTYGALEYAKTLLGKIQTEGRRKSKKERLDDMSKALKLVLEELNRIELPDRELVSLFISLRAKIVNLKAELNVEESEKSEDEKKSMSGISETLPRRFEKADLSSARSRRYSWC